MWDKIVNPESGRKVSIYGRIGKNIIKNYFIQLGGTVTRVYQPGHAKCAGRVPSNCKPPACKLDKNKKCKEATYMTKKRHQRAKSNWKKIKNNISIVRRRRAAAVAHEQQCPPWKCDHCNQPFATYDLAEQHEQHCPKKPPPTFYCDHCNQPFLELNLAEQHEEICPMKPIHSFEDALRFLFPKCYHGLLLFFNRCVKPDANPHDEIIVNPQCGQQIIQLRDLENQYQKKLALAVKKRVGHEGIKWNELVPILIEEEEKIPTGTRTVIKYFFNEVLLRQLLLFKIWVENGTITFNPNLKRNLKQDEKELPRKHELFQPTKWIHTFPRTYKDDLIGKDLCIFFSQLIAYMLTIMPTPRNPIEMGFVVRESAYLGYMEMVYAGV